MNIEAYNLDSLRKLVRSLQDENKRLKVLLDKADIAYEQENVFEEKIETAQKYDPEQKYFKGKIYTSAHFADNTGRCCSAYNDWLYGQRCDFITPCPFFSSCLWRTFFCKKPAYAFVKRDIGSYMFLKNQFVFFNFEEPLLLFILDYLAVMGLFVFIGHYLAAGLKRM